MPQAMCKIFIMLFPFGKGSGQFTWSSPAVSRQPFISRIVNIAVDFSMPWYVMWNVDKADK